MTTTLIIIAVFLLIIISSIVKIHNGIIKRFNMAKRSWSDVITQERQKNNILPEIERLTENFKVHESEIFTAITELRSAINKISADDVDLDQLHQIQKKTGSLINNLHAVAENYPELKSSTLFNNLMREIVEQQENVGAAIRIFNRNVEEFNSGIEIFPNSLINNIFTQRERLNEFTDTVAQEGFEYKPNF